MKRIISYIKVILGCLLIAVGLNIFLISNKLIPSGILGLATLLNYKWGFDIVILILIVNFWSLWLLYMVYDYDKIKEYLIPSLFIPIFIWLTSFISSHIIINVEQVLISLCGGFIMGYGYSFLYKEGYKTGAINILEDMYNDLRNKNSKMLSRIFDCVLLLLSYKYIGLENTLYSLITIVIIKLMTTKASIGISDSKVFYIITTKENKIKEYLMSELHHDFTMFDVEGGFTKRKSKIIMTVISTKDYFKVKEGIKLIDPKAFISITDNYEVINKNIKINE